uniref:Uncharacterized protein n=1 Tax=Globisporangium ultimum (strain ATCC 200006 / CBS 805.95 / DAOM BR144) TaxID=431595 RepID=K3WXM3_GLOUD
MSQPLFARPHAKAAVLRKGPPSINRRKVTIEPLLSEEMLEKLQMHLEQKIQGSIWQNEIRSKLARPLSATAFCVAREERLEHPLSAAQYVFSGNEQDCHRTSSPRESSPLFPYSIEAHAWTQQIAKCYTTMRFRVDCVVSRSLFAYSDVSSCLKSCDGTAHGLQQPPFFKDSIIITCNGGDAFWYLRLSLSFYRG